MSSGDDEHSLSAAANNNTAKTIFKTNNKQKKEHAIIKQEFKEEYFTESDPNEDDYEDGDGDGIDDDGDRNRDGIDDDNGDGIDHDDVHRDDDGVKRDDEKEDDELDINNSCEIDNKKIHQTLTTKIGDKCEFISYIQGYLKLFVNGQSYFSNRTCDNIFYWQCDYDKDCISQAVTMLVNNEHFLKSLDEHSHFNNTNNENNDLENKLTNAAGSKNNLYEICECIMTKHGQIQLVRNGYYYNKINISNNDDILYYWRCEKHSNTNCNGSIITILKNDKHYVKITKDHNHENNYERREFNENSNEDHVRNDDDGSNGHYDSGQYYKNIYSFDDDDDTNDFDDDLNYEPEVVMTSSNKSTTKLQLKEENYQNLDGAGGDDDLSDSLNMTDPLQVVTIVGNIVCEFVKSNQGNPKLCLNGYLYNRNRKKNNQYYWNCEEKRLKRCYGIAVTETQDDKHFLKKSRDHNHPPKNDRKIIGEVIDRIKQECIQLTEESASQIVDRELFKLPEDVRKSMPRRDSILRMINRKRRFEETNNGIDFKYKPTRTPSAKRLKTDMLPISDAIGKVCEIVESTKGNAKLIAQDYMYTLNKTNNNLYYWRCDQRTADKCMGYAVTNFINGLHYLKTVREHNHEVNPNRKIVAKIMKNIKDMALTTDETPTKIVDDAINGLDDEILQILPTKKSIFRTLNRHRLIHKGNNNSTDETIRIKDEIDENTHLFEVNIPVGTECNLFTPTNKGNLKLNLNGYFYHKNRIKNDLHYWQCEENRSLHCKGFATTYVKSEDGKHYIKNIKNHNHAPEERRQDIADIIFKIKEKARTSDLDATIIWNDEVFNLPDELKKLMPQRTAIMTMINRTRRKNKDPDELELHKKLEYDDEQEHIYEIQKLPDTECEFIASSKGTDKLTIDGYLFTRNKIFNDIHKWRCDEQNKDTANCRGYAATYVKENGKHYLKNAKNHNHPANIHRIEIANLIHRIKERARLSQDTSARIYDIETTDIPDYIKNLIPNREAILCMISRHRRKLIELKKAPPKNLIKQETLTEDHFHEPFVEPGSEVEIITSHKGTCKLNLNGYLYVKNVVKNNVHYWQCDEKNLNHCRGHATTIEQANGKHYLRTTRAHNHLAKAGNQKEIADAMNRIKDICLISDDGPKKIYADVVETLPKDLKAVLPSLQAITMIIKRHRRKFRPVDKSGINYQPQKIYPPEIVEIIDRMKNKILTTTDGPARIYNAEIANLTAEIREKLPKRENLLQTLKRTRRKNRTKGMYLNEDPGDDDDSGDDNGPSTSGTAIINNSNAPAAAAVTVASGNAATVTTATTSTEPVRQILPNTVTTVASAIPVHWWTS